LERRNSKIVQARMIKKRIQAMAEAYPMRRKLKPI
jgi:hypothetical protein